jgi:hypothetical protein
MKNSFGGVLLLDNDNVYKGLQLKSLPHGNFVLYTDNNTGHSHYSFVNVVDGRVTKIAERTPISRNICIGGYGFSDMNTCIDYCERVIMKTNDKEPYLSTVFSTMLEDNVHVSGHYLPDAFSIGTPSDILFNTERLGVVPITIVFDLDNTLVRTSHINPNDYSCVSEIDHMTKFMKYLKRLGHRIVIHTARGMLSRGGDTDRIRKEIAPITEQTLKELNIEYDEIVFGKPYGDLYIDDKSYNVYDLTLFSQCGFYNVDTSDMRMFNIGSSNRNNSVVRVNKHHVRKTGSDLGGEIYYYQTVASSGFCDRFPTLIHVESASCSPHMFVVEHIDGTNIDKIYAEGLMNDGLFMKLMEAAHNLHTQLFDDNVIISSTDIDNHYFEKFYCRASVRTDYPFDDFDKVFTTIRDQLAHYLDQKYAINNVIHGDLWFSNILLYKQDFKFIDMRGKFHNKLTMKGHVMYDVCKLYQSIIGLDCIIKYGHHIPTDIREHFEEIFWSYWEQTISIDVRIAKRLTGYLIFNTFFSYSDDFPVERKHMIWKLVRDCIA